MELQAGTTITDPQTVALGYCPTCGVKARLDPGDVLPWHMRHINITQPNGRKELCPGIGKAAVRVEKAGPRS